MAGAPKVPVEHRDNATLSTLAPPTEPGPMASEEGLSRISRGGSSNALLVFCSFPFSVTREQQSNLDGPFLLQPLAFTHSSLLTNRMSNIGAATTSPTSAPTPALPS